MEDAATSEISRAQLWQWRKHGCFIDGRQLSAEVFKTLLEEELNKLGGASQGRLGQASQLLEKMVLSDVMEEFLTIPAYDLLCNPSAKL
jgi:malate synthase